MKHLGISGGGTKIAGLYGAAEIILNEKKYKPDIISGISAGAILSLPLALGKHKEIKKMVLDFNLDSFFSESPIKENGKFRVLNALKNIVSGNHYLGRQDQLEKTIRTVISEDEFQDYKTNNQFPICIVGSVDFYSGRRIYVNLKKMPSLDLAMKFVNASASLPLFTAGIALDIPFEDFEEHLIEDKVFLYDGGIRDHSPTAKIIKSAQFSVRESCTIFSRPENNQILDPADFEPNNVLQILQRYVDITNTEISKDDELFEKQIIADLSIKDHGTFFLPKIMKGVYDVNPEHIREIYIAGKESVRSNWIP
jgi:predicted acylesterase/phospholipase RssA